MEKSDTLLTDLLAIGHEAIGGCIEWPKHRNPHGYGQVRRAEWGGVWLVHRLAYTFANGPIPAGLFICHRCDNPPCYRPEHLYAGTAKQNAGDMMTRGRHKTTRGEDHPHVRLTDAQVREIRARYVRGARPATNPGGCSSNLAEEFGISQAYVLQLARGNWRNRHLNNAPEKADQ